MANDKILSMIGLATKAGKIVSGEFSTEQSVKRGRALMVIISSDASENTKKKFTNMCSFYKVPLYFLRYEGKSWPGSGQRIQGVFGTSG